MLLRDQIVIQIGEELDGMVMIRSGDNRQGICPVKFLQEVWQLSDGTSKITHTCDCLIQEPHARLDKIYYPYPTTVIIPKNNSSNKQKVNNKVQNTGGVLQYYYNNINNNVTKNNSVYFTKQTNMNNNNIFAYCQQKNFKFVNNKLPFSSTIRPLSLRLSTPKHVTNLLNKTFRTDSQKRPLLLNFSTSNRNLGHDDYGPNFKIIPDKTGLKVSSIYTISENVEKITLKNALHRRNLYISSNSRPLLVRK